jgi:hypothetical protein
MAAPLQTAHINPTAAPNATSGHSPATIPPTTNQPDDS